MKARFSQDEDRERNIVGHESIEMVAKFSIGEEEMPVQSEFAVRSSRFDGSSREEKYFQDLLLLYLSSNLWTLLMTAIPVLSNLGPDNYYPHHPGWYTGNDLARLFEPIGGFLFNFYIFKRSGILNESYQLPWREQLIFIFFLGSAIYGQGAGFHSASNMFKNAFEPIMTIHHDDLAQDYYYYLRMVWEHEISHYLYAAGYAFMAFAQLWAYREHCTVDGIVSLKTKLALVASAIIYGLLVAAVAIDFPSGVIVAIIYLVLYGLFGVGAYLWHLKNNGVPDIFTSAFGRRPVVKYFILSYAIAFAIVILWIIIVGGIRDRGQAMG